MANGISAEQLWQFSLALYPKVKPLCLQWQNELGANVNLLLLLCYLERQQLGITAAELQQLATVLHNFSQQFTQPLRQLRQSTANANVVPVLQQQLKQALLQAELELERVEQQLLVQHCPPLFVSTTPLLESYLAQLNGNTQAYLADITLLRQSYAKQRC